MEGCIPAGILDDRDTFMQMFHKINTCHLKTHQWCLSHKKLCPVIGAEAAEDFSTAGLPCWDYSCAGLRLQEEGKTKKVFLAYAKRHIRQRTPLLLIENVKDRKTMENKSIIFIYIFELFLFIFYNLHYFAIVNELCFSFRVLCIDNYY